jgi:hypothetical protein
MERDRGEGKKGSERGERGDGDRDRDRVDRENDIDYAGQEERDKRIQAEIRQLQLETVRTFAPLGTWNPISCVESMWRSLDFLWIFSKGTTF